MRLDNSTEFRSELLTVLREKLGIATNWSALYKGKGKGKGLDTCYSATYMSQTRDEQRFTILEMAANWHESMVPLRIMWPPIARANKQLDSRCS